MTISNQTTLSRRDWFRLAAAGALGSSTSGWIETLAAEVSADPRRRKACILLWMSGGPSQTDTFDPKPGHANGGTFKAIETAVPGIVVSEHLPKLARQMKDIAIIRGMSTKEGDHGRATFNLRTGYTQQGPIHYPTLGSLVSKELERGDSELPSFVEHLALPRLQPRRVRPRIPRPPVCSPRRGRACGDRPYRECRWRQQPRLRLERRESSSAGGSQGVARRRPP